MVIGLLVFGGATVVDRKARQGPYQALCLLLSSFSGGYCAYKAPRALAPRLYALPIGAL